MKRIRRDLRDESTRHKYGSCLDPDLNKPTIKTFMRHTGTLNTDWPFNNTKESVLILGVIMVLWLC